MAARLYEPGPTQEELDIIGITLDDIGEAPPAEVWEENWDALTLFSAMRTQWRHGFNGPVGLDYSAIDSTIGMIGLGDVDRKELFHQIQILESEALSLIHKQQK